MQFVITRGQEGPDAGQLDDVKLGWLQVVVSCRKWAGAREIRAGVGDLHRAMVRVVVVVPAQHGTQVI